ncbi:MAG: hypothetical protein ACOZE7_04545 [Pseudomonadota bacterium]
MNLFCDSCGHRGPETAFLPAGAACFTCPDCGEFDVHPDEHADTAVLGPDHFTDFLQRKP